VALGSSSFFPLSLLAGRFGNLQFSALSVVREHWIGKYFHELQRLNPAAFSAYTEVMQTAWRMETETWYIYVRNKNRKFAERIKILSLRVFGIRNALLDRKNALYLDDLYRFSAGSNFMTAVARIILYLYHTLV
jgi:hypothetical protein